MERLWSLMLKEKSVQRQQMLEALMQFQGNAINMWQTVTLIDAIHIARVLHAITSRITRIVRVGERMRDQRMLRKARPNGSGPAAANGSTLLCEEILWVWTSVFQPSSAGRRDGGRVLATWQPGNQGVGDQGRPVRQNMELQTMNPQGPFLLKTP